MVLPRCRPRLWVVAGEVQGPGGAQGRPSRHLPVSSAYLRPPHPGDIPQAKELLDHLEGVLSNKPVEIVGSNQAVEIKPQVRVLRAVLGEAGPRQFLPAFRGPGGTQAGACLVLCVACRACPRGRPWNS